MSNKALVKLRLVLYSVWSLSGAWTTTMAGVKWDSMGWEEKSCLVVGVLQIWSGILFAFFDKSAWRVEEERKNGVDKNGKTPDPTKP